MLQPFTSAYPVLLSSNSELHAPFCKTKPYIFTETAWFQVFPLAGAQHQLKKFKIFRWGEHGTFKSPFSRQPRTKLPTAISKHFQCLLTETWLPINTFRASLYFFIYSFYIFVYTASLSFFIHPSCTRIPLNGSPIFAVTHNTLFFF